MISLGGSVVVASPKIVINLPGTYDKIPVKEDPIGSAVSEIFHYKHTNTQSNRHPVTLL